MFIVDVTGNYVGLCGPYESDKEAVEDLSAKGWEWRQHEGIHVFMKIRKTGEPPMVAVIRPLSELP